MQVSCLVSLNCCQLSDGSIITRKKATVLISSYFAKSLVELSFQNTSHAHRQSSVLFVAYMLGLVGIVYQFDWR